MRGCLPLSVDAIDEELHTRYTEHVQHLSQVENGPGSRIGLYFGVAGTHALGIVRSFFHVDSQMVCWHPSCVLGLAAIIFPFIPEAGISPSFRILNASICAVLPHIYVHDEANCHVLCEHPTIIEARAMFPGSCGTTCGCGVFSDSEVC